MGALTLIQSGFLGEGLTGFLRSSGWRILLLLCIVTFYQVVITLCKGEVDSQNLVFLGYLAIYLTQRTLEITVWKASIIWISVNVVLSGKVKSVSLVRRRLAQTRESSQIKLDGGILFPSFQSQSFPKILQYSSLG